MVLELLDAMIMHFYRKSFDISIPTSFSFLSMCSATSLLNLPISNLVCLSLFRVYIQSLKQFSSQLFIWFVLLKQYTQDYQFQSDQQASEQIQTFKSFQYIYQMKCVSIVYKRPTSDSVMAQFASIRPFRRSVDNYIHKLQEKQQMQKNNVKLQAPFARSTINTAQSYRTSRINKPNQNVESISIVKMRASCENIFNRELNPENSQQKKQKKFRSTFVKRKTTSSNFYSLKGIDVKNNDFFKEQMVKPSIKRFSDQNRNQSKIITLKKLKLLKRTTVLISIDFILNENNFWKEQKIDESAHRNWKILQDHSNIVWLTKRQNSMKKLQKFTSQFGLRLDGVYQIFPKKRSNSLSLSISALEKDFKLQQQQQNKQDFKQQIIVINSLKVDSIQNLGFTQFYNSFPVAESLRCIVHFIQIDMNDKQRFNSPLKILSKEKLPHPTSVNYLFKQFYINQSKWTPTLQMNPMEQISGNNLQDDFLSKQQMMQKYEGIKQEFIDYFSHNLKISLNKKIKFEESQSSLQFLIGDMLKRNFSLMHNYKRQCQKIHQNLQNIRVLKQKQSYLSSPILKQILLKPKPIFNVETLIKHKLSVRYGDLQKKSPPKNKIPEQNTLYYRQPVFLWKK